MRLGVYTVFVGFFLVACGKSSVHSTAHHDKAELLPQTSSTDAIDRAESETDRFLFGSKTYAIIVGVLSFADANVAGWSKLQRKDVELYRELLARNVPKGNIALLLDDQATQKAVSRTVARVAKQAPPGSTLLFYYAGHGSRTRTGDAHFSAYDTRNETTADTAISLSSLSHSIIRNYRGRRVVLMADSCYSGSLRRVAAAIASGGKTTAMSITSASASNLSTNNWTFTQTIIDGLRGDGRMDRDSNGTIDLNELAFAIANEMKYREKQRHGFSLHGVAATLPVAVVSPTKRVEKQAAFPPGTYVLAPHGENERVAQVLSLGDGSRLLRFYGYNQEEKRRVKTTHLKPIKFQRYAKHSSVDVFWDGKYWPAQVLKLEGDFHYIQYKGYKEYWNEWVLSNRIGVPPTFTQPTISIFVEVHWRGQWRPAIQRAAKDNRHRVHYIGHNSNSDEWVVPSRIRRAVSNRFEVEWRGKWWPATVLNVRSTRYLIHYTGYGSEWDEWVDDSRIRN